MGDFIDAAAHVLINTERRLEISSNNISNISAVGFKRKFSISHVSDESNHEQPFQKVVTDFSSGTLKQTGNPLDISIVGEGHFLVRDGDQYFFTRSGQFSKGADGSLRNANAMALQLSGGGDAILDGDNVEILPDGTILDGGVPVGAIGVFSLQRKEGDHSLSGLMAATGEPRAVSEGDFEIRQGMLESSNVVLSDEMVAIMASVRQAEGAAHLVRSYDQLIGQAITTFARAGR